MSNTPLIEESNRVRVCKNLTCSNTNEYPMSTELCPDCKKKMCNTTQGANLFHAITNEPTTEFNQIIQHI